MGRHSSRSSSIDDVSRERMKASGKTKVKRKRGAQTSFGELVRKLLQPESDALEPKIAKVMKKQPVGKVGRGRKS